MNHVVVCSETCCCSFAILTEKCYQNLSFENIQYWDFSRVFAKIGMNSFVDQV